MKKSAPTRKLSLTKEAVAVLTAEQLRQTAGARPPIFPPSWFECGFTIWCD